MTKKKYYNKNTIQIRSKPKKSLFQMFSFWLVSILSIIIIITVVNLFTGRSVSDDEHTATNNNINSDEINENVTEEYELNNDYNTDGQELNNDNNASEQNNNNNNLEKDLLDDYNQLEIDYARIMLMTNVPRIDPIEPFIFVYKHSAGDRIFTAADSITYPENVTVLWGPNNSYSNHDVTMIAYSAQGDGHITIYPFPTDYEMDMEAETDRDYRILAQQIIENAYSTYVDPSEPHLIAEIIDSVEFIYE